MLKKIILALVPFVSMASYLHAEEQTPKAHCVQLLKLMSALAQEIKEQSKEPINDNELAQVKVIKVVGLETKKIELRKLALEYIKSNCSELLKTNQ
ncbi:MAG: hypothetical protein ACOYT8_03790 [Candidatus Dependentiae bacterium]